VTKNTRLQHLPPHILAMALAIFYAWVISSSLYVKSSLQFVAPVMVMMLAHIGCLFYEQGFASGFAHQVYRRSMISALALACMVMFASFVIPTPASGAGSDAFGATFGILMCIAVLAVVVGIIAVGIYAIIKSIAYVFKLFSDEKYGKNDSRIFDLGSMILVSALLVGASLEGLPSTYSFGIKSSSMAERFINASPKAVWSTLETATSPNFPLPKVLHIFPQPVAVILDEGIELNAMRIVKIKGREGTGNLVLKVIARDTKSVTFKVLSDNSPIADWVAHKTLKYSVASEKGGTRLFVNLEHHRLLSPAWFFSPAMDLAAWLAMDVLVRDVKTRAERSDF